MLHNPWENLETSCVNWKDAIAAIAGPLDGNNRERWLENAARSAGISFSRARSLFYADKSDPPFSIGVKVLSAVDRAKVERGRKHGAELAQIYKGTAEYLARRDADFHRADIDALVEAARILGAADSA